MPLDNLTLATFLKAEFGFLGVTVVTFTQTPLLKGEGNSMGLFLSKLKLFPNAGVFDLLLGIFLGLLIS